eukprot:gene2638-5011_t
MASSDSESESKALLDSKFAYAYKHHCVNAWLSDRQSKRRIGIVDGGVTGPDWNDWSQHCADKGSLRYIGTDRGCRQHQSPHLKAGLRLDSDSQMSSVGRLFIKEMSLYMI